MSGLAGVLAIAFTMVFTENYVLVQFLGICPFLGVSQKLSSSLGMSGAVIFVMTLASAVTYLIYTYIMVPLGLAYLSTIIFILVIAALVQFVEIFLKRFVHPLYSALGIYLPLITTNCAVLAVTLLNISENYNLLESCVDGFAAGVGFGLALVLFSGVRKALERAKPPACWNGLPITLVAAALTSMTFMGFTGIADNLFG
ncbi:MAG: RnfABCDGE type electron transport complex subunit A [Oscillospiraceae bacterium]|nr:RnfABCDGE type electron transport complex subunit A [Oscillospiraceae bacterium]MCC8157192.1 RnfABCDGE type electron transport complex subunit A [Oscillospiraceae bacterium]MCD7743081.1 RnfABCDGE type electron transport complex subunit A [Oscillospiraceae bacterium]MCD7853774.1 RnfABCDGE type electron transport complex subunit A [Oscillospiraceae bacterium]MCD7861428.1 RnfABCDGE type electron transport complex subunit A [Oscillospiraceae bacterium]